MTSVETTVSSNTVFQICWIIYWF